MNGRDKDYMLKYSAVKKSCFNLNQDTSSNPQVSALIPQTAINRMERICQRHESNQTLTLLFESTTHESINI